MNSRERFEKTCTHQTPDRPPIDYTASPETERRIKALLGVETEREMLDALGIDFYYLSCRDISQNESCLPFYKGPALDITETERTCPLGIRFDRGAGRSKFAVDEAMRGPLEEAQSPADVLAHPWPAAGDFDFAPMQAECEANADRVIVGGLWTGIMGDCYRMYGFENFLMAFTMAPDVVHALIDRMTEMYLDLNEAVFSLLKGRLDVWFFGNDFGSQAAPLLSPPMWRDFFFENIRRLCEHAHSYDIRVMMHSCGSIVPIIPMLIEAGVDILDPIQVTAEGMDPNRLKADFGDRLVLHGGIDTQHVLPESTPERVHTHCVDMLKRLSPGGGYVFAPSQMLQNDIPPKNIEAMYRAGREFRAD